MARCAITVAMGSHIVYMAQQLEPQTGQKFGFSMGVMYRMDGAAVKWYIEGVALGKAQFLAKGGVMPADNKCYQQCPVRGVDSLNSNHHGPEWSGILHPVCRCVVRLVQLKIARDIQARLRIILERGILHRAGCIAQVGTQNNKTLVAPH